MWPYSPRGLLPVAVATLNRIPFTLVTTSHMTQGRVEYESTTPRSLDKGLDLWEEKDR
jgi:hypothetical protein